MLWEIEEATQTDRVTHELVRLVSLQHVSEKWLQDLILVLFSGGFDLWPIIA